MKTQKSISRQKRTRSKIFGTANRPRLSVFRSNRHIFAQAIDDEKQETLAYVSEKNIKEKEGSKTKAARQVGLMIAEKLKKLKIGRVIFDKGSFKYHGRVKALAEGAREGGLNF